MKTLRNERGSILVVTVIILVCMTLMGSAMLKMTQMELIMVNNDYIHKNAFYAAESGIAYATADMANIAGSEYFLPDPTWEATVTYDMPSSNNMAPTFEATVWHKVGIDPVTGMDAVILWGDVDGDYYSEENFVKGFPIEFILSHGEAGAEKRRGNTDIEVMVRRESLVIDPDAALYVGGSLLNNGGSQTADGEYNMCAGGGVKDIVTTSDAAPNYQASDYTGGCGAVCDFDDDGANYPVAKIARRLIPRGTEIVPGNNLSLGDAIDNTGIFWYKGDIDVMNNLDGYGILVIDGNLTTGGSISWHGLIIVTGDSTFNGGGAKQIYGAVVTGGDVLGNGSPDFLYDCDVMNDLEDNYLHYKRMYWTQK